MPRLLLRIVGKQRKYKWPILVATGNKCLPLLFVSKRWPICKCVVKTYNNLDFPGLNKLKTGYYKCGVYQTFWLFIVQVKSFLNVLVYLSEKFACCWYNWVKSSMPLAFFLNYVSELPDELKMLTPATDVTYCVSWGTKLTVTLSFSEKKS